MYVPATDAEEIKVERFCKDRQHLLELTPKKVVLFIIRDWNAKVEVKSYLGNSQVWPWSAE